MRANSWHRIYLYELSLASSRHSITSRDMAKKWDSLEVTTNCWLVENSLSVLCMSRMIVAVPLRHRRLSSSLQQPLPVAALAITSPRLKLKKTKRIFSAMAAFCGALRKSSKNNAFAEQSSPELLTMCLCTRTRGRRWI